MRKLIAQKNPPKNIREFIDNEIEGELIKEGLGKDHHFEAYIHFLNKPLKLTASHTIQEEFLSIDIPPFQPSKFFVEAAKLQWKQEVVLLRKTLERLMFQEISMDFCELEVKIDIDLHRMPLGTESVTFFPEKVDYPHLKPAYQALFQLPSLHEGEEVDYFHFIDLATRLLNTVTGIGFFKPSKVIPWEEIKNIKRDVV